MKKFSYILSLIIIIVFVSPLFSKPKLVKSAGLAAGISIPQNDWNLGYVITGQADFGEVLDYLFLSPYISYSNAGKSVETGSTSKDISIYYLTMGIKIVGYINSKPKGFYFGGSLSYNYISSESLLTGQLSHNADIDKNKTTKVGFAGLAGYLYPFKKFSVFIEADYIVIPGGFNNFLVFTGLNLNL